MKFASKDHDESSIDHRILTECVIGMPLSDFFLLENNQTPAKKNVALQETKCIHSLKSVVQSMFQISTILFDKPRSVFAQSLDTLDICFEVQHSFMAIHSRIGAGSDATSSGKGDSPSGFFVPMTRNNDPRVEECPFWMLLARSVGIAVEFIVVPGGTSFETGANEGFYLRANLMIPEGYEVTNIAFYGDDGISSLSPDLNDDSEIKEGRQSIGFVVKCIDSLSREGREELWVFQYDEIIFQRFDSKRNSKNEVIITANELNEVECTFISMPDDEEGDASSAIVPKRRHLSSHRRNTQMQRQSQVNLCGSRGTGGVISFGASTSLSMFDLEEDEDNASSADEDECLEEEDSTT
ncbi:hypothetical protein ACHAXR_010339 [Thalassiosira sp. AJA248-18]